MTAVYVVAGVLAFICLLLALPVGMAAEYSGEGLRVWFNYGFLKMRLVPAPEKKKKPKKAKKPAGEKKKPQKSSKTGTLAGLRENAETIAAALGRLRRAVLIRELTLHICVACEDPANAALAYGGIYVAEGDLVPLLHSLFRIKKLDLTNSVDFAAEKTRVYARAKLSVRLGALAVIALKALLSIKA